MSAPAPAVAPPARLSNLPLAIPDPEADELILGRRLNDALRNRLRSRGEWPPVIYVGGRACILIADIVAFLTRAKETADAERAARQERGRRNIAKRWERERQEHA